MSNSKKKSKKNKKNRTYEKQQPASVIEYSPEDVLMMMEETSRLIAEENAYRLSSLGVSASESGKITDYVEFWNWMDRNYANSGHFASSENMKNYMSGTKGQQQWASRIVQGKGYEWDWMTEQRKSFKNIFKRFNAGDVANRPGSDITEINLITGAEKEYQLKAYTSKSTPHLKNTPKDMSIVTNVEKAEAVSRLGYEDVIPYKDNEVIKQARNTRLGDMVTGKANPNYSLKNIASTTAKAGITGFIISAGFETVTCYKKWKEGKLSTWEYLKEIMKNGCNAGVTASFSSGIMIPVSAAITTAGISSLISFPVSFVVTSAVDKVIAPAFALGDYKKNLNEATYYCSLTDFCSSLASAMDDASCQYVNFIERISLQIKEFNNFSERIITDEALNDFNYYASLSKDEIGVIVSQMVSLLNDTDTKYDSLKDQNWFQRMIKTVTGKNKATKEDIHRNYERLGIYVSKAVETLYSRQRIDEKILMIYGDQIVSLCKSNASLNARIEKFETRIQSLEKAILLTRRDYSTECILSKQMVDENAKSIYHEAEALFIAGQLIDAFSLFNEAANSGVGRAYYYLGEYYINGYGHLVEDETKAIEYWRQGMNLGDPLATYQYGLWKYQNMEYQCKTWIRKHINSVLRLAKNEDLAALYVLGHHLVNRTIGDESLDSFFDSIADSLKYFNKAAKKGYWPAAYMFYNQTERIRKSGTIMPNYFDSFKEVEWYQVHLSYCNYEIMLGTKDYDKCARHLEQCIMLRDDKTEAAGFLAFILDTGLIDDSLVYGFSKESSRLYFESGLKSTNEIYLSQVGMLYYCGLGENGLDDNCEGKGKDCKKAYSFMKRCFSICQEKQRKGDFFFKASYGLSAGTLGAMYLNGDGIEENESEAIKYLNIGYECSDPGSISLLALCYEKGYGVVQNKEKAKGLRAELCSLQIPGMNFS